MNAETRLRDYVETVWRPRIQADGGEIRFVGYENNKLTVRMLGECSKCDLAGNCLKDFLVKRIERDLDLDVTLMQIFSKPYFIDK